MTTHYYDDIIKNLKMLTEAQDAESDMRAAAREAKHFVTKRDGQWDPYAWQKMEGRFRGTFDMTGPIIEGISGEIEESDFTLRVSPASGEASEQTAKTLDGLIRHIRNISDAESVFNAAGRSNVIGGFDVWEVVQDWIDADSFDQDLFIRRIPSAVDSVWFDIGSTKQDRSDAKCSWVLTAIPTDEYKEKFPDGSGVSVGDDKNADAYTQKAETITVGRLVYKKQETIQLARMTDGSVYRMDDKFKTVSDDLKESGITVESERTRTSHRVYSRLFDGQVWLGDAEETAFKDLPIIPVYGNFDIVENKCIYYGKVEKLYDQQRSLNYAMSRDIEDGALSPSPTTWMTRTMAQGEDYSRMNLDRKPVRYFTPDPEAPGFFPTQTGGPIQSQGLQTTIANMQQMINTTANFFSAQQGNASAVQSGVAGANQISQGNVGSIKWFKALEVAICQTGKVIIGAIPKVYDSTRQVRILEEDGTGKIVTLNDKIIDADNPKPDGTPRIVELNDLSVGQYDVVCNVGPAFNNQQKETAQAFLDAAAIDPSVLQQGLDIWLKSQQSPGMDQMAERARVQLLNAGLIPESQWTDKERQKIQAEQQAAQNQPPQEDPMMVAARAEEGKAQAAQMEAQNKAQQIQIEAQIKMAGVQVDQEKITLEREKLQLDAQKFLRGQDDKFNVDAAKITQGQQKLDLQAQKQEFDAMMQAMKQQQQEINDAFMNLKVMREAMGVDTAIGSDNAKAYTDQAKIVDDVQES